MNLYFVTAEQGTCRAEFYIEADCEDEARDILLDALNEGDVVQSARPATDYEIRQYIVDKVCQHRMGRVPYLVGKS